MGAQTYLTDAEEPGSVVLERNPGRNRVTLGFLWLIYGIVRLTGVAVLIVYSSTAAVMFGSLLTRVPDAFTLMAIFHFAYLVVIGLGATAAVFSIVAGWALLAGTNSARFLAVVAALLAVCDIPFGTTLGAYTLAAFVSRH